MSNLSLNLSFSTSADEYQMADEIYVLLSGIMFIIIFAGVLGNGVVIVIFLSKRIKRTTTASFLTFLCFCDLIIAVIALPTAAFSLSGKTWLFGDVGCAVHGFTMTCFGITSIATFIIISMDRYISTFKPNWVPHMIKMRVYYMLFCLLYGIILATPPLLGWNSYVLEEVKISCSVDWKSRAAIDMSYCISLFVLGFIIPLFMIAYAYIQILMQLRTIQKQSYLRRTKNQLLRREGRLINTTLIIIGTFCISWFPYALFSMITMFGNTDNISPIMTSLPSLMAKASVLWNPIIYTFRDRQFRNALQSKFSFLNMWKTSKKDVCRRIKVCTIKTESSISSLDGNTDTGKGI